MRRSRLLANQPLRLRLIDGPTNINELPTASDCGMRAAASRMTLAREAAAWDSASAWLASTG